MKEYCFVELITGLKPTQRGLEVIWESEKAQKLLNEKGKEGWRFVGLLPDEKGTAIMERQISEKNDKSLAEVMDPFLPLIEMVKADQEYIRKIASVLLTPVNKPWYKFW